MGSVLRMNPPADLITPREASRITGMSLTTLARYMSDGRLDGITMPTGHRRYRLKSVQALIAPSKTTE